MCYNSDGPEPAAAAKELLPRNQKKAETISAIFPALYSKLSYTCKTIIFFSENDEFLTCHGHKPNIINGFPVPRSDGTRAGQDGTGRDKQVGVKLFHIILDDTYL